MSTPSLVRGLPFDAYPGGGRQPLGPWKGSNAKHDYGLKLMRLTGQTRCAYCDADFAVAYETWLTLVVDHVVPLSVCRRIGIPGKLYWDLSNAALACAACNGFCNRYSPAFAIEAVDTPDAFYDLRDKIFIERRKLIAERHESGAKVLRRKPLGNLGRKWRLE